MHNIIVIDFETGGLSPLKNPITQIGALAFNPDTNEELFRYKSYVQPYDEKLAYEQAALQYTGITLDMCITKGKPLQQVVEEFSKLTKSITPSHTKKPILAGHNIARFDIGFLKQIFGYCKLDHTKFFEEDLHDTLTYSKTKWKGETGFKLEQCCHRAGVELVDGHDAMNDVVATTELLKFHISCLRGDGGGKSSTEGLERTRKKFTFQF